MGACCCCSARRTASSGPPLYYYYPGDLENEPLSSTRGPSPAVPVLLVDPNLDTSISSSCQAPNILSPRGHNHPTNTVAGRDADRDRFEHLDSCGGLKVLERKSFSNFESDSPNVKEKLSSIEKLAVHVTDEDDVCPTCLEEYDAENPRIITKCKHHFHLSCILEWFERSNTCAICDRIMEVENMALFDQSS